MVLKNIFADEYSFINGQPKTRWFKFFLVLVITLLTISVIAIYVLDPYIHTGIIRSGIFWNMPLWTWVSITLISIIVMLDTHVIVRITAIFSLGILIIGMMGILEPFGVFHDSWQNVGIGQLAIGMESLKEAWQVPYFSSSPGSFLLLGLLGNIFPDTQSFVRVFPVFCLLLYSSGIFILATLFAQTHFEQGSYSTLLFPQYSILACLALSPNFLIRINPAPQSLAFALMPFCLAAIIYSFKNIRFRILALLIYVAIVFTHTITAIMILVITLIWWFIDYSFRHRRNFLPLINSNSLIIYICIFFSWLIYLGYWTLRSGESFIKRIASVLSVGQHSVITANSINTDLFFIWTHRIALVGTVLLIIYGIWLMWSANRMAGFKVGIWLGVASALMPLIFFGEFADRGPLFASLPAALAIGFGLSYFRSRLSKWLIRGLMVITILTTYITAYSNQIGEIITENEVSAFNEIAIQSSDLNIIYGYTPPFSDANVVVYSQDRIRTYALGAADFSYEKLTKQNGIIVISDQMHQATISRGSHYLAALELFQKQLQSGERYDLVFDNGKVKAFRVRQH